LGDSKQEFLCYNQSQSGWSPELTEMHEKEAGDGSHPIDRLSRYHGHFSMKPVMEKNGIMLDVGCSSGFLLSEIRGRYPHGHLIGADYLPEVVSRCAKKNPSIPMLQFDLRACPLDDNSLDGVVALNVLEHIDEDEKALAHIFRVLKPGGLAHIEVPEGPTLYDFYDEVLMHHRRYGRKELIKKCKNAGFRVIRSFGIGWMICPIFFAVKKKNRWLGKRLSEKQKKTLVAGAIHTTGDSQFLRFLLKLEELLGQCLALPIGIRHCVLLEKP
jgi:SAM-dependent methyltransferase